MIPPWLIQKSGTNAQFLAIVHLYVEIDAHNKSVIPSWSVKPIYHMPPEPRVAKLVSTYEALLQKGLKQPLGIPTINLDSRYETVRSKESSMADLLADTLRAIFKADVALINGGAIRGNTIHKAGIALTPEDLRREYPFADSAMVVDISGSVLRKAIEHGLSALPDYAGSFPQVSNIEVWYDPHAPVGKRVQKITIGTAPLADDTSIRLVTTNYIANGGDGYNMFPHPHNSEIAKFSVPITELLIEQLSQSKTSLDPKGPRLHPKK